MNNLRIGVNRWDDFEIGRFDHAGRWVFPRVQARKRKPMLPALRTSRVSCLFDGLVVNAFFLMRKAGAPSRCPANYHSNIFGATVNRRRCLADNTDVLRSSCAVGLVTFVGIDRFQALLSNRNSCCYFSNRTFWFTGKGRFGARIPWSQNVMRSHVYLQFYQMS